MKKVFVFFLLCPLMFLSFEACQRNEEHVKIIDQWWRFDGRSADAYSPVIICSNIKSVQIEYNYYYSYIAVIIIRSSHITTLSSNSYWGTYTENIKSIKLSNNFIEVIENGAFTSCRGLTEINLQWNNITALSDGLFSNNHNLQILDLSYNAICSIGNATFASSLMYLNLKHNSLQQINFKLPEGLINLELSFNNISFITRDSFSGLTQLETVKLNNNALKTIPFTLFNTNSNLKEIDLSYNKISAVSKTTFFLQKITDLNLQQNRLSSLDFILPVSLGSLDLSFNSISTVNDDSFSGLTQLSILKLNDNLLEKLQGGLLNPLENLKNVYLQRNNLTVLQRDLFASHNNLVEVDLSENNISSVEAPVFHSKSIQRLNLRNNKIKYLNFIIPENVKNLDLSFNSIAEINNNSLLNIANLTTLNTSGNFLKHIPVNLFKSLNYTKEIQLGQNKLTPLSNGVLTSSHAVTLNFSYNEILLVERNVFPLNGTRNLYLQNNKLKTLNFKFPFTLVNLDLSYNSISSIEQSAFDGLSSLSNLQLNNNLLHILPAGCFQSLQNLKGLYLSNNTITMTYGTFSGLGLLETLEIANNSITDLTESILNDMGNLFELDISNNLLTSLEVADITRHLKKLHYLYLENNKFQCDYLLAVIAQLEANRIIFREGNNVFQSNVRGINCIHGKSSEETDITVHNSGGTNEVVPLLKKAIDLIYNSSKQQQRLQQTLQALNNNMNSGNVSEQRLQHILEEINTNLVSGQTFSNNSEETLRHTLEKISSNLNNERETFNYSYAAKQVEILKELLKELKNNSKVAEGPYVTEKLESGNALETLLLQNNSNTLATNGNTGKTSGGYILLNIALYGLLVIGFLLLYIQYIKIKVKKARHVTGLTEMTSLELE